jgi:hypothetical protein
VGALPLVRPALWRIFEYGDPEFQAYGGGKEGSIKKKDLEDLQSYVFVVLLCLSYNFYGCQMQLSATELCLMKFDKLFYKPDFPRHRLAQNVISDSQTFPVVFEASSLNVQHQMQINLQYQSP